MVNSVKLFNVKIIKKIEKIKNNQIKIIKINNINKKEINNDDYKVGDLFEVLVLFVEEKSKFGCDVV